MKKLELLLAIMILSYTPALYAGPTVDELPDLTGGVVPLISYDARDSFMSGGQLFSGGAISSRGEVRYIVRVKNQTGDPIEADSLVVVVDKIVEMARGRDVTDQLDVIGTEGHTQEGKPYFRIPQGNSEELAPYSESEPIMIEIMNPDLLRLFPPTLRVLGLRRTATQSVHDVLDTMMRKGLLSPDEAANALERSRASEP